MSPELEAKLFEKYPKMFINHDKTPQQSCLAFGIETNDGWYELIDMLCENIQQLIDASEKTGSPSIPQVIVDQVKEKFATLRFYYHGGNGTIRGMVRFAESMSSIICETCGNRGTLRGGGWLVTACDAHSNGKLPFGEYKHKE